jgi:hypothetical protein
VLLERREEKGALDPEDAAAALGVRPLQPVERPLMVAQAGTDVGEVIG